MMNKTAENNVTNNVALKEERAKRYRRHVHYSYDDENRTMTVEMCDGYDNLLGKEVFTEEDMKTLAQEKGEKIINRKLSKAKAEERRNNRAENFEVLCKYVGAYCIGYAGGILYSKRY